MEEISENRQPARKGPARSLAALLCAQLAYMEHRKDVVTLFQEAIEQLDACDMHFQATASQACLEFLQYGKPSPQTFKAHGLRSLKNLMRFLAIYAPLLHWLNRSDAMYKHCGKYL